MNGYMIILVKCRLILDNATEAKNKKTGKKRNNGNEIALFNDTKIIGVRF